MKKIIFSLILFSFIIAVMGQNTVTMGGGITSQSSCNLRIISNGYTSNHTGTYPNNANHTLTITSNSFATRPCVFVNIVYFDVHSSDTLYIHDGNSTSAPVLAKLNNANVNRDPQTGIPIVAIAYMASYNNTSGAITLHFVSNSTNSASGFELTTECRKRCQRIELALDSVNSTKYPHPELTYIYDEFGVAVDSGMYNYVDVCPYDDMFFQVNGIFPENGLGGYTQSNASTTFTWTVNDHDTSGVGMTRFHYDFAKMTAYTVSITATDQEGCETLYPLLFRVRTSANPIKDRLNFPEYCTGSPINLRYSYDEDSDGDFLLDSIGSSQISSLAVTDTIFLPDGEYCVVNGVTTNLYRSPVTFTSFSNSAKVTQASDILYIKMNIEHSYIGDLRFSIHCPNGQSAIIKNYPGGGGTYLGLAWDQDSPNCDPMGCNPVGSGQNCSLPNNINGSGWTYIWSENQVRGYTYAGGVFANALITNSVNWISAPNLYYGGTATVVDSSRFSDMTHIYRPEQSFSQLINCPLNGTWYIEVQDNLGIDDGFIYGWELGLNEELLPQNWSYEVGIDSVYITGDGVSNYNLSGNQMSFIPTVAGELEFHFNVVDDFGCHYDTNFYINVVAAPNPNLGRDTIFCTGMIVELDASMEDADNVSYFWNNGYTEPTIKVVAQGEYIVKVISYNADSSFVCVGGDTIFIRYYDAPMLNFISEKPEGCAPLSTSLSNLTSTQDSMLFYHWLIYDENGHQVYESELDEPKFVLENFGDYDVLLRVVTPHGCYDSLLIEDFLKVRPQPYVEFDATPEISLMSENGGVVYFRNYTDSTLKNASGVQFKWDFGDGTTDEEHFSTSHTYTDWDDYIVTFEVTTEYGCNDANSHIVVIEEDLYFPNVITPNGDGINDVFAVRSLNTVINPEDPDKFRENELYIYDKWGKLVYQAKNYDTFARNDQITIGKKVFTGEGLPEGNYNFRFYYKGKKKTTNYAGTINIIR